MSSELKRLFALIHVIIISLVFTTCNVIEPFFVVEVPTDGAFDAFFELKRWLPTKFALEFRRVDGITGIVTKAVGDVGNEVEGVAFGVAEDLIYGLNHYLDEVDVLPFVEAADVVGLGYLAFVKDDIDGTGMVFYIEPVAHVLALAIYRQGLSVSDIINK